MTGTAHVALFDGLADWEIGYLIAELRTGRFTAAAWNVVTVAEEHDPITTMGGLRIVPDLRLSEIGDSNLLVLPGGEMWDRESGTPWVTVATQFLDEGTPVAAICGATGALARAGLLDERRHTSSAREYLASIEGYRGHESYEDARAVADGGLVTAGPQSPVHFAVEVLRQLRLAPEPVLRAYEALFHDADPAAFPVLMDAAGN